MKDNKVYVVIILLIISIVFHGVITAPKSQKESRFEIFVIGDSKIGVYDKENEKVYYKDIPNVNYSDWTMFIDLDDFK